MNRPVGPEPDRPSPGSDGGQGEAGPPSKPANAIRAGPPALRTGIGERIAASGPALAAGEPAAAREFLAALAALLDAEAAALLGERNGATVLEELALDARRGAVREAIAVELRLAASEAKRAGGAHVAPSSAAPGAAVAAATFGAAGRALAALVPAEGPTLARARGVLALAALALEGAEARREGGLEAFGRLREALSGEAPPEAGPEAEAPALAARLRAGFAARQALVADEEGDVLAAAPAGPLRAGAPGADALAILARRVAAAAGPVLDLRGEGGAADLMRADLVAALPLPARPRGGARLVAILVAPGPGFARLGPDGWGAATLVAGAAIGPPPRCRFGRARARRLALAGLAAAALAAALLVPVPDRIRAEAVLEPEGRRFVAAGFAAVLRRTHVEAGDEVRAGEPIAELEGEALMLARVAAEAKRSEAQRRRDAALGEKDVAAAELARLEAEAAAAERDLNDWRLARLVLVAPVDGVVLDAPLRDAVGAPLREGDVVAEIAPLDRLRVGAMAPAVALARLPERPSATLEIDAIGLRLAIPELEPAARVETFEGEAVLPLRAAIDNPGGALRPGQRGVALIPTGRAPLGAVLFRDAWSALRRWTLR